MTQAADAVSYPEDGHDAFMAIEDWSFWFRHRNRCITALVDALPPPGTIFDVGGGNGFVAQALSQAGHAVTVVEPGPQGARNARARGLSNVICATTQSAGFAPSSLPAVGLFDVIEHVDDDAAFMTHIRSLLRPDGVLYSTVPAYGWLWSDEDVAAGHYRRHTAKSVRRMLESAGFEIAFLSYFFRPLILPVLAFRAIPTRLGLRKSSGRTVAAEHGADGGRAVKFVERLLSPEVRRIGRLDPIGFGSSIILAARVA